MGSYTPLTWAQPDLADVVLDRVVRPTLAEMAKRGTPFVGCLYVGLALTAAGPRVIEFNVRFGDPDIQPVLALLESPLGELLSAAAHGRLADVPAPVFRDGAAVTVVLASAGYPESSTKGVEIRGLEQVMREAGDELAIFHAGTRRDADGTWRTNGGRVLGVCARGQNLHAAIARAYAAVHRIEITGGQWRRDSQ